MTIHRILDDLIELRRYFINYDIINTGREQIYIMKNNDIKLRIVIKNGDYYNQLWFLTAKNSKWPDELMFNIMLSYNYPNVSPLIYCEIINHPDIDLDGKLNGNVLNEWKKESTLYSIVISLVKMLHLYGDTPRRSFVSIDIDAEYNNKTNKINETNKSKFCCFR